MLYSYAKQVRRLINDGDVRFVDENNIRDYVNRARRLVAERTQCIRFIPNITSSITAANVLTPGSGYTNPTVTISPPDFPPGVSPYPVGSQATATAAVTGGAISGVQITYGGTGYFQPTITITDPTGTGATAMLVQTPMNLLFADQEVYPFSGVDLTPFPGVQSILFVRSVSIIYANYRYSLPRYAFSAYQARIRNYPFKYDYVATTWSQFGQGAAGSAYFYPLPSQTYQMEWDCCGIPQDLTSDLSVEAIPQPWQDAVPFFAAAMAYMQLQNFNAARFYEDTFEKYLKQYSAVARVGYAVNPYGRP